MDQDCLITLLHSLIVSRVDYCNSLYLGLPNYLLKKLQSIMNKSARLIFSVALRVPTNRFLIKLHWLPIKARIEFKICLIVFKALRFGQPKYIADMLSPPVTISHLTLRTVVMTTLIVSMSQEQWMSRHLQKGHLYTLPHGCIMDCQPL